MEKEKKDKEIQLCEILYAANLQQRLLQQAKLMGAINKQES